MSLRRRDTSHMTVMDGADGLLPTFIGILFLMCGAWISWKREVYFAMRGQPRDVVFRGRRAVLTGLGFIAAGLYLLLKR